MRRVDSDVGSNQAQSEPLPLQKSVAKPLPRAGGYIRDSMQPASCTPVLAPWLPIAEPLAPEGRSTAGLPAGRRCLVGRMADRERKERSGRSNCILQRQPAEPELQR